MKLRHTAFVLTGLLVGTATLSASPSGSYDPERLARLAMQTVDRMANDAMIGTYAGQDPCATTSGLAHNAAVSCLRGDFALNVASCINEESGTPLKFFQCLREAVDDFAEGLDELRDIQEARLDLCGLLGGGIYDPDLDEDEFVQGVNHPYLPALTGATWVYHADTDEGLEVITVTILPGTIVIDDIECILVQDVVEVDGVLVEDTTDWFAQDREGTVWYMGEIVLNYEDGVLADLGGSWKAGEDGALPGRILPAQPVVGETYRGELLLTEAEDAATVLSLDATATTAMGTFTHCIQTLDFTPLEPGAIEHKFYAPGIGLVLETKPGTSERLELISFTPGS